MLYQPVGFGSHAASRDGVTAPASDERTPGRCAEAGRCARAVFVDAVAAIIPAVMELLDQEPDADAAARAGSCSAWACLCAKPEQWQEPRLKPMSTCSA